MNEAIADVWDECVFEPTEPYYYTYYGYTYTF
jgi:hypothetical protein